MKTTSYKISKELAEAGFKAETDFYWAKWNEGDPELVHAKDGTPSLIEKVPAYDFETILENENLPREIELKKMGKDGVIYELRTYFNVLTVAQQANESLADSAARLWLELKKLFTEWKKYKHKKSGEIVEAKRLRDNCARFCVYEESSGENIWYRNYKEKDFLKQYELIEIK